MQATYWKGVYLTFTQDRLQIAENNTQSEKLNRKKGIKMASRQSFWLKINMEI